MSGCNALFGLGDLRAWTGISGQELGELRLLAHVQNLDIDLSSHQILRRFLGLSGEERETMINLLTGKIQQPSVIIKFYSSLNKAFQSAYKLHPFRCCK